MCTGTLVQMSSENWSNWYIWKTEFGANDTPEKTGAKGLLPEQSYMS